MTVLVLGAGSTIGAALAAAFARDNQLLLAGRNQAALQAAAEQCRGRGAREVLIIQTDLGLGAAELIQALGNRAVDLVINAACATSRLRDRRIGADELSSYLSVDLLAPVDVVREILRRANGRAVGIVFVSSVLSLVRSPGRDVYGSLKRLQERVLETLAGAHPASSLLTVMVGARIARDRPTRAARDLARAVFRAVEQRRKRLYFGFGGRALVWLFNLQPVLFSLAIRAQRMIRSDPDIDEG